mmetsp:Transcript_172904/g.554390  ORF Transcript_172904/g.554390 Transcript_172904/m.554390 type:complete len:287 (+) Transcript_172904:223-1083(+)
MHRNPRDATCAPHEDGAPIEADGVADAGRHGQHEVLPTSAVPAAHERAGREGRADGHFGEPATGAVTELVVHPAHAAQTDEPHGEHRGHHGADDRRDGAVREDAQDHEVNQPVHGPAHGREPGVLGDPHSPALLPPPAQHGGGEPGDEEDEAKSSPSATLVLAVAEILLSQARQLSALPIEACVDQQEGQQQDSHRVFAKLKLLLPAVPILRAKTISCDEARRGARGCLHDHRGCGLHLAPGAFRSLAEQGPPELLGGLPVEHEQQPGEDDNEERGQDLCHVVREA